MMSGDGGATWSTVASPDPAIYTFGMAARPYMPLRLYVAGATSPYPQWMLNLYTSLTGGSTWDTHSVRYSLGDYNVYHLLAYAGSGLETVLIGTNNGVYRYTEPPTGAAVSPDVPAAALRAHPNPAGASTDIEFALAGPEEVSLLVVDVRGRVVARWIGLALGPGPHRATWNAGDLPSGVYFARLRAGGREESAKLVHFR
jgi:hypothetical protein